MATFVLIPGAGGDASYWSQLVPELEARGHRAIPVEIREDDPTLGLPEYADITLAAIGARTDTVLVAQSMGAFTAAMVAAHVPVAAILLLNCEARLAADPTGLARRMSGLLDLDPDRVLLWLFARCVQESPHNPTARDLAHRLAP